MSAGLAILAAVQHTARFTLDLNLVVHRLPLWFLVFSLLLPRLAMAVAWFQGILIPFHLQGLLPPLAWLLLPRVLVLYLIYVDQGLTLWFLIHLVVAVLVFGGSGRYHTRSRRHDY